MVVVRLIAWCCVTLLLIGLAISVFIIFESRRPEDGANMVLMGLPLVGGAMVIPGGGLAVLVISMRHRLSKWERFAFGAAAALGVVPFLPLFHLG